MITLPFYLFCFLIFRTPMNLSVHRHLQSARIQPCRFHQPTVKLEADWRTIWESCWQTTNWKRHSTSRDAPQTTIQPQIQPLLRIPLWPLRQQVRLREAKARLLIGKAKQTAAVSTEQIEIWTGGQTIINTIVEIIIIYLRTMRRGPNKTRLTDGVIITVIRIHSSEQITTPIGEIILKRLKAVPITKPKSLMHLTIGRHIMLRSMATKSKVS